MRFPLVICFILLSFKAYSQATIAGAIVGKEPATFAFVTIFLKKDSVIIKTTFTDSIGVFRLPDIPSGTYSLGYFNANHKVETALFNLLKDTTINFSAAHYTRQLEGVEITSRKPLIERKIDRIIFNVSGLISTSGDNAYDALKKAPTVSADESGNISIRGISGTGVMINGRLLRLSRDGIRDYLKSISADQVEKIEIITNPSSKYDAQGVAGLLNIILKKNARDGVNGRASASYEQTSYPKYGGDVDLNYRSGKLNVFGSTSIKKGQYLTEENLDNIYSRNITPYYYFEKDNRLRNHTSSFNKLGIDYAINESNDIGLQIEHSYFLKKGADRNDAVFINSGSMLDSIYKTGIAVRNYYNNLSGNLHYAVKLDTAGQSLSFDLDYTRYSQPENLTTTTTERYGKGTGKLGDDIIFKNQSEQKINIYAAKGDYSKRIFKDVLLEGGSKYYSLSTDNDLIFQDKRSDEWLKNTEKSNKFEYKESNLAVYTNLSKDFGDKWSLQGGLRYEHTTWSGSSSNPGINIGKEYNRLFPSVFVQYNATPDNQISLNYTQRISRPDYTDLNPFRYYTNPNSYIEGNPFLQPAITNSVDLSYTFKTKYYFDLFLYKTQGQITQVPLLNATDHSYKYQSINLDNSYNWGFNSYIPVSIRPWWQSSYSLIVGFNGVRSNISGLAYRYSNFNIQFSTNQQFVLSKQQSFFGELNFFYQPAGATQGMFILGKMADLSVGVKKLFFKEKLTVAANLLDVLNAAYITAKVDREDQYSFINGNYDKRGIRLTITYKFGNTSMKSASERKSGIQEEKSRIK